MGELSESLADRPWLRSYDPGVPHSLKPYPARTLQCYLRENAARDPDRPQLITTLRLPVLGRRWRTTSLGELESKSNALAVGLIELGLRQGDRVAIVLPNCTAFAIAFYAILKAGGVVAACNPAYPAAKMAHQLADCDAEIVITLSLFYPLIRQIQGQTRLKQVIVSSIKEYFHPLARLFFSIGVERKSDHRLPPPAAGVLHFQTLLKAHAGERPPDRVNPDDLAILQYTGGTTGVSKGAMISQRALVANMLQSHAWMRPLAFDPAQELGLSATPMFHAYGMVIDLCYSVTYGQRLVMVINPRDVDDMVDILAVHRPTSFAGVPAMFNALLNHRRIQSGEVGLDCLHFIASGSAPLPPALQLRLEEHCRGPVCQGYGMSESPAGTHGNPLLGGRRPGSIGLPWPDVEMRIVSLDDGADLPPGAIGELVMRGPTLMEGYHRMAQETAEMLREIDGQLWLFTGDVGCMDADGYCYLVDRKKDMVIISGFNVYPTQIEDVLRQHPAVAAVCVVGIPHPEHTGQEALKAWIVLGERQAASAEQLIKHCEQFLAPYEVPRRFSFVAALPHSAIGKVLRRELLRQELEGAAAASGRSAAGTPG